MTTPCQSDSPAINHDRVTAFVDQVMELRRLQRHYRKTIDCITRRKMEALEQQVDVSAGYLAADLLSAPPCTTVVQQEGGVP